jgi:hypothetical protein
MAKKLKFSYPGERLERIINLEEARNWDYSNTVTLTIVENHLMQSYDDLLKLASSDEFKDKEVLELYFLGTIYGG